MDLTTVNGIVLRCVDYKESDRILTIMTREQGKLVASARGARKLSSALMACSQPFIFGEFVLFRRSDKYNLNQCALHEAFYPLRSDLTRLNCAAFVLSCANDASQENEPNERLFSLCYHALSFLAFGESDPVDLTLCFFLRFLDSIGYRPSIVNCAVCGADVRAAKILYFSARAGGVLCKNEVGGTQVSSRTLEIMRRMLLLEDDRMDGVRLSGAVRAELTKLLEAYAAERLDKQVELAFTKLRAKM